MNTNYY